MILTATIDNSTISFALFAGGEEAGTAVPRAAFCIAAVPARTGDEYAVLLSAYLARSAPGAAVTDAMVASVVPPLTGEICRAIDLLYPTAVCRTVGAGLKSGLVLKTDAPAELGADLVAMAGGALALHKPPFLILSCGTVTTLSAVGAGEPPVFLGCAILPGISLSARALKQHAAQLPAVSLLPPQHAVGTNTCESLRAGLLLGQVAAITGLIDRFEKELDCGLLPVIVTGEEANVMRALSGRETVWDDMLVHRGLYRLTLLNEKKNANFRKRV